MILSKTVRWKGYALLPVRSLKAHPFNQMVI
jgi:hypothetical protein